MNFDFNDLSGFRDITTSKRQGILIDDLRITRTTMRFSIHALANILKVKPEDVPKNTKLRIKINEDKKILYIVADPGGRSFSIPHSGAVGTRQAARPVDLRNMFLEVGYSQVVDHPNFFVPNSFLDAGGNSTGSISKEKTAQTEPESAPSHIDVGDTVEWMACPKGFSTQIKVQGVIKYVKQAPLRPNVTIAGIIVDEKYANSFSKPKTVIPVRIDRLTLIKKGDS